MRHKSQQLKRSSERKIEKVNRPFKAFNDSASLWVNKPKEGKNEHKRASDNKQLVIVAILFTYILRPQTETDRPRKRVWAADHHQLVVCVTRMKVL